MANEVGNRIRSALAVTGMSQRELAYKSGIHESNISNYISGKYVPKPDNMKLIADALGVSAEYLMGWQEVDEVEQSIIENDQQFADKLIELLSSYDEFAGYTFTGDDIKQIMNFIRFTMVNK